jgi:hypothetical protein
MRTRRLGALLVAAALAVLPAPTAAVTEQDRPALGAAWLEPVERSGPHAAVTFVDAGAALRVRGTAAGLDPTQAYYAQVAATASCARAGTAPARDRAVVGRWVPTADGTASELTAATGAAAYLPLARGRTVAIWLDTRPDAPLPAGLGPPRFRLQACGVVRAER